MPIKQDDADERDDAELFAANQQRENRADARRWQRGNNRDRVDVALVQNAKHDVDGNDGGEDQDGFVRERVQERGSRALIGGLNTLRKAEIFFGLIDGLDRVAE